MIYNAVYEYDGDSDAWLVRVDGVAGCHTYGATLNEARERIREALGLFVDDADSAEIIDTVLGAA